MESFCMPHLEWEGVEFPFTVNKLRFKKSDWGFDSEAFIVIKREENYQLNASIQGVIFDFNKLNDDNYVGVGNIIEGQEIEGFDCNGNIVKIQGSILLNHNSSSLQFGAINGILLIDSFNLKQPHVQTGNPIRLEWFVCNNFSAHLWKTTYRNLKHSNKKIRIGLDEFDDSIENFTGCSFSKDYTTIEVNGLSFILSKVPKEFLSHNFKGICIEFRESLESEIDDHFIDGIRHFLSFLLGNEIYHIGNSFIVDQSLVAANFFNHKISEKSVLTPIKFNMKYDWGDLSFLMNTYLPKYLEMRAKLPFDECLSRYWIARSIPLGVNLPVLSSALELIANSYLKSHKEDSSEYISKKKYLELIEKEMNEITLKLATIEGNEVILNKISGAYKKGVNEKMTKFFTLIDLEIGRLEKQAINLRNKMAHASRDYSVKENIHSDLLLTRVYEVLFHRVILKLLGYDKYYIDYSITGCPSKHIKRKAGE